MLDQNPKVALPDLAKLLASAAKPPRAADNAYTSGPSFQDLLDRAIHDSPAPAIGSELNGIDQESANLPDFFAVGLETTKRAAEASATDYSKKDTPSDHQYEARQTAPKALHHSHADHSKAKAVDQHHQLDSHHAAKTAAAQATSTHKASVAHPHISHAPTDLSKTPPHHDLAADKVAAKAKTTNQKKTAATDNEHAANHHQAAAKDAAKSAANHPAEAKKKAAESPRTGQLNEADKKAQEAATRFLALDQQAPTNGRQLQDALKLLQDISRRLGLKDEGAKSGRDERVAKLEDKKPGRLDLLRTDLRHSVRPDSLRIEVVQSPQNIPAALKGQNGPTNPAQVLGAKGDEALKPAKDISLFNPAMPQAVIHHTVELPAGVPQTVANLTRSLHSELRNRLNSDVVGQAKIVLSGHDSGEIRLVLHPENLGEVRIHLKLADSTIGGTIFVDDKNVLQVFKDNMADLQQAFRDGGLDASQLQLAVSERHDGQGSGGQREREADQSFVNYARDALESSVPPVQTYASPSSLVNLVV